MAPMYWPLCYLLLHIRLGPLALSAHWHQTQILTHPIALNIAQMSIFF